MEIPRPLERDACAREEVYERMNLSDAAIREIELMVKESPAREVGGGALRNTITIRYSHKSSRPIHSESHTCESIFHNLCDLDPNVVAYYSQVRLRNVKRPRHKGIGFHLSAATIDVLVFYLDTIKIVECKHLDTLEALMAGAHPDWYLEDDRYVHAAYRNWASERGLLFETFSPPFPSGRYQSNIETLQAALTEDLGESDQAIILRVIALCTDRDPQAAAVVCSCIPGCTRYHIMQALIAKSLVGTLRSELLDSDRFLIGLPNSEVEQIDNNRLNAIAILHKNPVIHDAFLVHPPKYREIASKRLLLILDMRAGKRPWSRRYKALSDWFVKIDAEPGEMLRLLIPNYANSGNREPRALPEQIALLDEYVQRWQRGEFARQIKALNDYLLECQSRGISPLSKTTFSKKLKLADPARHALATEGFRGYQHAKRRSPPLCRSVPCQLPGHTVHIDATQMDVRAGPLKEFDFPAERAWIYVARDVRGKALSRSFILGNARTEGLAILWRIYVYRNGELPRRAHEDRGPENTADWHKEFAKTYDIKLRIQATADARSNQPAEDLLNHINTNISHWLDGNTLPDRKGRAVDGKFKSIKTARLGMQLVCSFIDDYLFDELAWTRKADGLTINEDYERRRIAFGMGGGQSCLYDDDFLINTSFPVVKSQYSEKDGIRTTDGYYLNEEMQVLLREHRPDRVLRDCIDPSILYVQIKSKWFKALRSDVWEMQDLSHDERLAYLMTERAGTSIIRAEREAANTERYRVMRSESQRPLNEPLAPPIANPTPSTSFDSQWDDESLADVAPFESKADDAH